jgi:hypothetical protein
MELVKTFGENLAAGTVSMGTSYMPGGEDSYAYRDQQTLSQVYVVRGMK